MKNPGEDYEYRYISICRNSFDNSKTYYEVDKNSWEVLDELEEFDRYLYGKIQKMIRMKRAAGIFPKLHKN